MDGQLFNCLKKVAKHYDLTKMMTHTTVYLNLMLQVISPASF
jgi:hypothetical protein